MEVRGQRKIDLLYLPLSGVQWTNSDKDGRFREVLNSDRPIFSMT